LYRTNSFSNGPATTALLGLSEEDYDTPLIISNSDQILQNWDCQKFLQECKEFDGGVLTYTPPYDTEIGHPDKNSYVEIKNGKCIKFAEKIVLSNQALVGIHYFRSGKVFKEAYEQMVESNERAPNGEFYISLMYNSILRQGGTVCAVPLQKNEKIYLTGEPKDYYDYINNVTKFGPRRIPKFQVNESGLKAQIATGSFIVTTPTIFVFYDNTCQHQWHNNVFCCKAATKPIIVNIPPTCRAVVLQHDVFKTISQPDQENFWKLGNLADTFRGWCIGDFSPSVFRTKLFELGLLLHKKGEKWPAHIHRHMTEYNYILSGSVLLSNIPFNTGDSFVFKRKHPAIPEFLTDCLIACIKTPSVPGDKEII